MTNTGQTEANTQSNNNLQPKYPVKQQSTVQIPCQTTTDIDDTLSNRIDVAV